MGRPEDNLHRELPVSGAVLAEAKAGVLALDLLDAVLRAAVRADWATGPEGWPPGKERQRAARAQQRPENAGRPSR
jgi:hypothetical protein